MRERATAGPWKTRGYHITDDAAECYIICKRGQCQQNAALITELVNHLETIIDHLEK